MKMAMDRKGNRRHQTGYGIRNRDQLRSTMINYRRDSVSMQIFNRLFKTLGSCPLCRPIEIYIFQKNHATNA